MAALVNMPKLGFDMAEGTLVRWLRAEGEEIKKGEVLAEIETDKATVEVESSLGGIVRKLLVEAGASVPIGTPVAVIGGRDEQIDLADLIGKPGKAERAGAPSTETGAEPVGRGEAAVPPVPARPDNGRGLPGGVRASPLARKMAEEGGIDLQRLKGTGPGGRITKRDLQTMQSTPAGARAPAELAPGATLTPLRTGALPPRTERRAPLKRLHQAIGRRMTESKQQIPHFYVTHEFNMGPLMALRAQVNAFLPEQERLTVNDFLVKAVALALLDFPNLNASIQGDEVVTHGSVNVGVAVAVEGGLLNVVCQEADLKPLRLISAELRGMIAKAREGKVRSQDVEGSTFTISNMGMLEVENFIAIINPPEAAILAVGSIVEVPVVEQGEVRIGERMKATISADHRVTDGSEAARFLQTLARHLEEPLQLVI
ncbi:MAG: dihydrolipoamide acetyltransferase family protein [Anaerolineales bacterium]|jgi:pyruvate dehydrogenase E2 component (dihydrolipoamide acetyltransferase)